MRGTVVGILIVAVVIACSVPEGHFRLPGGGDGGPADTTPLPPDAALSWCKQNDQQCAQDADCCGGLCTNHLCAQPVVAASSCTAGVAGDVCTDCNGCCSRLCESYEPTGARVCQPTPGCRVVGDLCYQSTDCCGGDPNNSLPGAGNVQCVRQNMNDPVGICRNSQGCEPEGDICHFQNLPTCGNPAARNDCCGSPGNSGVCRLDSLGVPRCYGLGTSCRNPGQTCSNPLDCCAGEPCVPNAAGQLVCHTAPCVGPNLACTQTADCCNGATCNLAPGSTYGTCGAGGTCLLQGQACSVTTAPCCANSGTCTDLASGNACGMAQTSGCACFIPVL
jgi:hypothetical protein